MNILIISILISLPSIFTSALKAEECPMTSGVYGKNKAYQNYFCRFSINLDGAKDSSPNRKIIFNDKGQIQIAVNYMVGGKDSDAARVFYIYPLVQKKKISTVSTDELVVEHASGAQFKINADGRMSSPNVKMSFSQEINGQNKSGVEINSYSNGLVVDFGYKTKKTPMQVANSPGTVTDKNNKKCYLINSDLHTIVKDDPIPRYKTNEALHGFFAKKCPGLDISDLLKPFKKDLDVVTKPSTVGAAPKVEEEIKISDESRKEKEVETVDEMEALVEEINSTSR